MGEPNFQHIPHAHSEGYRQIAEALLHQMPLPTFVEADYSGMELCIMQHAMKSYMGTIPARKAAHLDH